MNESTFAGRLHKLETKTHPNVQKELKEKPRAEKAIVQRKVKANAECVLFFSDFCRLWVFRVKGDSQPVELHYKTLNIHLKNGLNGRVEMSSLQ